MLLRQLSECWVFDAENQVLALAYIGHIVAGRSISDMDCVPSGDSAPSCCAHFIGRCLGPIEFESKHGQPRIIHVARWAVYGKAGHAANVDLPGVSPECRLRIGGRQ